MTISVHLISIPDQEVVASRVIYLPEHGGEFGRAPSCDIPLPDQTKRISRVHGQISLTDDGYTITDSSNNGSSLNERKLVKGKAYPLSDGDIVKIEHYTMLISTLVSSNQKQSPNPSEATMSEQPFSLDLNDDGLDFLEEVASAVQADKPSPFSKDNVLNDDPFAIDPFEDLNEEQVAPNVEVDEVQPLTSRAKPNDLEYLPANSEQDSRVAASIEQLLVLTKENQHALQNPQLQQKQLFDALEKTVDQFLADFAPTVLEKQFNEYLAGGLFSNKQKKYWRIYRKHYQHRQESGDFRRQFKALFMENMQKQNEEQ